MKYKNFPLFILPSEFINFFANQLPVYTITTILHNPAFVGAFNMSVRLLGAPTQLIAGSVAEVFKQRIVSDHHENLSVRPIFLKSFKMLAAISFIPFLIIGIWGPEIFLFVLGDKWLEAGKVSQILAGMYFFRFIVSPLTYVYYLKGKLKEDFYNHIYFLVSNLFIFLVCIHYFSVYQILAFYAVNYALIYLFVFFRSYSFSK